MKRLLLALAIPFLAITACETKKIDKHVFQMNAIDAFERSFEWWDDGDYFYQFHYNYEGVDSESGDRMFIMDFYIDNTTASKVVFKASKFFYKNEFTGKVYDTALYDIPGGVQSSTFEALPGGYVAFFAPLITDDINHSDELFFHIVIGNDEFRLNNIKTDMPL